MSILCYTCKRELRNSKCTLPCKTFFLSQHNGAEHCKFGERCHRLHSPDEWVGSFVRYPDRRDACLVTIRITAISEANQAFVGNVVAHDNEIWNGHRIEKRVFWSAAPKFRFVEPPFDPCLDCDGDRFFSKCVLPCKYFFLESLGSRVVCKAGKYCHKLHTTNIGSSRITYRNKMSQVFANILSFNRKKGEMYLDNGLILSPKISFFDFVV